MYPKGGTRVAKAEENWAEKLDQGPRKLEPFVQQVTREDVEDVNGPLWDTKCTLNFYTQSNGKKIKGFN